jgi:heme oxygenase (biliverdin-IX-beta and delta-forming)
MQSMTGRLRAATQSSHSEVESLPVVRKALAPSGGRDEYIDLLRGFYSAHSRLGQWQEKLAGLPYRPFDRLARLQADLNYLGAAVPAAPPTRLVLSEAEAWGIGYVVEGSVLGSAIICSLYGQRLELDDKTGGSYMRGYGADNKTYWQRFCASLELWASQNPELCTASEESARATFGVFKEALMFAEQEPNVRL